MSTGPSEEIERGIPPASFSRRLFALCLDWFAAYIIARLITGQTIVPGWLQLLIFFIEASFFTILIGGSAGQVVAGIRIVDIDTGMRIGFLPSIIRTLLICLVIPPLFSVQGRGLHDRAVRSVASLSI